MLKKNANPSLTHCCNAMKYAVEDPFCYLYYNRKFREYWMRDDKSTSGIVTNFCFHCGSKLPGSLRSMWYDILEKEYNLEYPNDDLRKVPKEFRTEAWWVNRNIGDIKTKDDHINYIRRICGS